MNFVAISTNTGDTRPYVAAETSAVDELTRQGIVERVLLKADYSGVILLLDVTDEATARAIVDALPIAAEGLTTFTLTPVIDPAEVATATAGTSGA